MALEGSVACQLLSSPAVHKADPGLLFLPPLLLPLEPGCSEMMFMSKEEILARLCARCQGGCA